MRSAASLTTASATPDHALEDYTIAHELTPKDPGPLVNRGIVYYTKKGKFDEAIADFDLALKLNPKKSTL